MYSHWELRIWHDILFLLLRTKGKKANLLHPRPTVLRSDTNFTTGQKATGQNWGKNQKNAKKQIYTIWDPQICDEILILPEQEAKRQKSKVAPSETFKLEISYHFYPPPPRAKGTKSKLLHRTLKDLRSDTTLPPQTKGKKAKLQSLSLRPPDRRSDTMFTTL